MTYYTAVRAVVKGWSLFVEDLQDIQNEDEFKKDHDLAKNVCNGALFSF